MNENSMTLDTGRERANVRGVKERKSLYIWNSVNRQTICHDRKNDVKRRTTCWSSSRTNKNAQSLFLFDYVRIILIIRITRTKRIFFMNNSNTLRFKFFLNKSQGIHFVYKNKHNIRIFDEHNKIGFVHVFTDNISRANVFYKRHG